jgi:EAL domain-containing protein (putative c-di-GMP-specific phosphodiesterase class I)
VAEGIETQAQLEQLRRTRCDAVQGFLLARPMPAGMVTTMLAGGKCQGPRKVLNSSAKRLC